MKLGNSSGAHAITYNEIDVSVGYRR